MQRLFIYLIEHKNYAISLLLIVLVIIVVIPFIINCLFKLVSPCNLLIAEWDAGDALIFYGAVLSFFSTTLLSALALWQNHVIKEENNKHTAILERMEKAKNQPFLVIDEVSGQENAKDLSFYVKNMSNNIAHNITFFNFCIIDNAGNVVKKMNKKANTDFLTCSSKYRINLANPPFSEKTHRICFDIQYYDMLGEKHELNAIGIFADTITVPKFTLLKGKSK